MTDNAAPTAHSSDTNPSNVRAVSLARIETLLTNGVISRPQNAMLWGSNYAVLVQVKDDDLETLAVYKPQRGERPLWDFPDGTLCYREVLSYLVSEVLGWSLVPPTVLRNGPHGLGSLQVFIEHDPQVNYFNLDDRFIVQLQQFATFDYLVNNTDRKGGHLLLDRKDRLWGIDHGLTFHTAPKLRTVIWEFAGQCIPAPILEDVHRLLEHTEQPDSSLRQRLNQWLTSHEIDAMLHRMRHLLEIQRYPNPGPGPNHPWPPI